MKILVVVDDLMFRTRIEAHLSRLGLPFVVASPARALSVLASEKPSHVVVNLAEAGSDLVAALAAVPGAVLGFGPHVDRDRFLAARKTGATVVANSTLEARLESWVAREGA